MDARDELSVGYFEMKLKINSSRIDDELVNQPELQWKVGEQAALARSRAVAAKEELKRSEARARRKLDEDKYGSADKRDAAVTLNADRKIAFAAWAAHEELASRWETLREVFTSRSYLLRDLASLHVSGFISQRSVGSPAQAISDDDAEARRKKLAATRKPSKW